MVEPLGYVNAYVVQSDYLLDMWLLIRAQIEFHPR